MTAQFHEVLILDGEKTSMAFCPPLPEGHPRLMEVSREEAAASNSLVFSTACWRQYIGTWEIKDGRFYLAKIEGMYRLEGEEPLPAEWFTGVLRIPRGEMLQYVHMGFGSIYEEELHIKIEQGMVTARRVIDNRGKDLTRQDLSRLNLPGSENRFEGDDEL